MSSEATSASLISWEYILMENEFPMFICLFVCFRLRTGSQGQGGYQKYLELFKGFSSTDRRFLKTLWRIHETCSPFQIPSLYVQERDAIVPLYCPCTRTGFLQIILPRGLMCSLRKNKMARITTSASAEVQQKSSYFSQIIM